jgi:hypothetical protein
MSTSHHTGEQPSGAGSDQASRYERARSDALVILEELFAATPDQIVCRLRHQPYPSSFTEVHDIGGQQLTVAGQNVPQIKDGQITLRRQLTSVAVYGAYDNTARVQYDTLTGSSLYATVRQGDGSYIRYVEVMGSPDEMARFDSFSHTLAAIPVTAPDNAEI